MKQEKNKESNEHELQRNLLKKKKFWQNLIFILSFILNFALTYDTDICVVVLMPMQDKSPI